MTEAAKPPKVHQVDGSRLVTPTTDRTDDIMRLVGGSPVPDFNTVIFNALAGCLWYFRDESTEGRDRKLLAAASAMRGFAPKNEVEGMMAAQAVALHHAAMECARRAMLPDQPSDAAARLRKDAANLSRAMVDMAEAIERRRGKAPQVVRVERVVVNEGGQAIVGNLAPGGRA